MNIEIKKINGDVIFAHECPKNELKKTLEIAVQRGISLASANLEGAYLRNANLEGAYLRNVNLRDANLINANLRGADLRGADLEFADLRGADLRGADLRDANLINADLRGADLRGANLRGANLDLNRRLAQDTITTLVDIEEILKETSVVSEKFFNGKTHLFTVGTLEFAAKKIYHKINS
jgi:hypothetical protein